MIKKNTIASFKDGGYAGEYDWKGGIPLSIGEEISVMLNDETKLIYELTDKVVTLTDNNEDQDVEVRYYFSLKQ